MSFTSLQPLIKEAAHMHEQLKMDKWQKHCSVGYKTHSSLSSWNTYFNEYGRYFAEMAHSCHTEKNITLLFSELSTQPSPSVWVLSSPQGSQVGTKGESNDSALWRKKILPGIFCSWKKINWRPGEWSWASVQLKAAWVQPEGGRRCRDLLGAAARYENMSVGAVITVFSGL